MHDENEEKKRWLYRYKNNRYKVARLEEKLLSLSNRIESIRSPNYSGIPKASTQITIEELIADKMDLERRIKQLKEKGIKYRSEIQEAIDNIEVDKYAEVLEHWFINCMSADDIGDIMGYSSRYIFILYSKALQEIQIL